MNAFFSCQTKTLEVFYDLLCEMRSTLQIGHAGFFVAGSDFYDKFLKAHPSFEREFVVIKEWKCLEAALENSEVDLDYLKNFDRCESNLPLFAACMGDRRIYQGKKVTFSQDYAPRYSETQMLSILEKTLRPMEKAFHQLKPSFTASLYPAMYGDLLTYMLARKTGAKHFDLRLSRMKNYVMFAEGIYEPSAHIARRYEKYLAGEGDSKTLEEAKTYLQASRSSQMVYEGAVKATQV